MNAIVNTAPVIQLRKGGERFSSEALLPEVELFMQSLIAEASPGLGSEMALHQISTGGKRVRARLALQACSSFGVQPDLAIAWAAAVELLHNATLIHDDIQDGDTVRRGQATVGAQFGLSQGINAGDLMLMLPYLALRIVPVHLQGPLSVLVAECATRIVRGQIEELRLCPGLQVSAQDYLQACEGKTGELLALPVVGAALLSGMTMHHAKRLASPFVKLGLLFQLQDDVVDLFGDKGREKLGCDVYEGKVSALFVELLHADAEAAERVAQILKKPRALTTGQEVIEVYEIYAGSGALQRVLCKILEMKEQVMSSEVLRKESELAEVAQLLVSMALAPIAHLLGEKS